MTEPSTQDAISSLIGGMVLPRLKSEVCEGRRVLIIDDEPISRSIAKALLEKFGFAQVEEVPDGAGALALMAENDYALVISDYLMEPLSGLDLLRKMRADGRTREIPFLMLTASFSHEMAIAAKRGGVKHYLLKPFRLEALHLKLLEILAPHELRAPVFRMPR